MWRLSVVRNLWANSVSLVIREHLTWFKWEAYSTWLSGAVLLMIVYWAGAELLLIDPNKLDLATWQAVLISAGSLTLGWLV